MSRKTIEKKVVQLINTLRPQLKAAGIEESQISKFVNLVEEKTEEQIVDYLDRVTHLTLKGGAYHGFMGIYGLRSIQWWENMKMLGETDLREHKLLNAEAKKLREAWKNLHVKPKKPIAQPNAPEGTLEGVSLRSEE